MSRIQRSWQSVSMLSLLLWPIARFYLALLTIRRYTYKKGWACAEEVPLPVIVVGNLSVGGTGKTPLCAYLVSRFKRAGWKPAIVSRGYGGKRHERAHLLSEDDSPALVGDEPIMLFKQTEVPVCVCVNRSEAVRKIAQETQADIVFSDDGLQHLAMPRIAEIVVVDGQRGFGNGWVMPAGPLRDSFASLSDSQYIAVQVASEKETNPLPFDVSLLHSSLLRNKATPFIESQLDNQFSLVPAAAVNVSTGEKVSLESFYGQRVHAVAGIGHPKRFFDTLSRLGLEPIEHPKADHAAYTIDDLTFDDDLPIMVTTKDAVKLEGLTGLPSNLFQIDTSVHISDSLDTAITELEDALDPLRQ
ncbi:MAG: tetraacyldisaccharide 4'-kinase [Granulosicoccus sp.]